MRPSATRKSPARSRRGRFPEGHKCSRSLKRLIFKALHLKDARGARSRTKSCNNNGVRTNSAKAEGAGKRRRHERLGIVPWAVTQRSVPGDKANRKLPPPLIWEFAKGTGYTSPAIAGDRLVFMHRVADEEIIECLHPETGASRWRFRYATAFEDRYGYNNGPRSSPVIDAGGRVYTVGAEGKLHCLDLASGKVTWKRDLQPSTRYRRTSSELHRLRSSKASS